MSIKQGKYGEVMINDRIELEHGVLFVGAYPSVVIRDIDEPIIQQDVGECLGKHSEVDLDLDHAHISIISEDEEHIQWLKSLLGCTVSGFNPIERYQDMKADGLFDYDEE